MDRGTQFHAMAEAWIKTGWLPPCSDAELDTWLGMLAMQWSPTGARAEVAWGLRADGSYAAVDVPEPHVYVARDGAELLTAGTADIVQDCGYHVLVADIKTGSWPVRPARTNSQVLAAGLALMDDGEKAAFQPAIYYARSGEWDYGDVIDVGSRAWVDALKQVRAEATLPPEPRPGAWCAACWERKHCPEAP